MASNENILGSNVVLFLMKGTALYPLCCGRELAIDIQKETKEATKKPSATWRSYYSGLKTFGVTFSTLSVVNTNFAVKNIFDLLNTQDSFFFMCKNESRNIFLAGKIILNNIKITANDNDAVMVDCTAVGDGELFAVDQYQKMFIMDGSGNPVLDGNGQPFYTLTSTTLPNFINNC